MVINAFNTLQHLHLTIKNWKNHRKNNKNLTFNRQLSLGLNKLSLRKKIDWKKIQIKNLTIVLNVFYAKTEKNISCLCLKASKTSYSFKDSKQKRWH